MLLRSSADATGANAKAAPAAKPPSTAILRMFIVSFPLLKNFAGERAYCQQVPQPPLLTTLDKANNLLC